MSSYWKAPRMWEGGTAFVVGGGPSVTSDMLQSIRGRHIIAVNMSYLEAPCASGDFMFFADLRLWDREYGERKNRIVGFPGTIVTTSPQAKEKSVGRIKLMRRIVPDSLKTGLAVEPDTVAMERTSLQGAMNLCYHLGARRIVLLGADNRDAPNGRIHWHGEYPWTRMKPSWDIKKVQLGFGAQRLKDAGIEVINCSPVSTLPFWPIRPLDEVIKEVD